MYTKRIQESHQIKECMKKYIQPKAFAINLSTEATMIESSGYDEEDSRNTKQQDLEIGSSQIWGYDSDSDL